MKYPAIFTPADNGGFVISFRDIPEAITQGDDENDSLVMAEDALQCALEFYFEDRRTVPMPSRLRKGERGISLPLVIVAKVLLLNEMIAQNIRKADLSKKMNIRPQEVTRLLNVRYPTKIDTMALALKALGKELQLKLS